YYFVNPFVRIEVISRRVYVFRGRQAAAVVTMDRENMNLLEVLAKAGGLPFGGKAFRIRVIRGDLKNPIVYDIDLSTLEGMKSANLAMEANDYVYIETPPTLNDVVNQIMPVM